MNFFVRFVVTGKRGPGCIYTRGEGGGKHSFLDQKKQVHLNWKVAPTKRSSPSPLSFSLSSLPGLSSSMRGKSPTSSASCCPGASMLHMSRRFYHQDAGVTSFSRSFESAKDLQEIDGRGRGDSPPHQSTAFCSPFLCSSVSLVSGLFFFLFQSSSSSDNTHRQKDKQKKSLASSKATTLETNADTAPNVSSSSSPGFPRPFCVTSSSPPPSSASLPLSFFPLFSPSSSSPFPLTRPRSAASCQEEEESSSLSPANHHHDSPLWRSEENRPFERKLGDALLFCGNSNEPLARAVADRLSTKLGKASVKRFADGEVNIQFTDSLRGKDVYIIQPTSTPVNEHLVELLLMISTCRRASAKKITAVIPYYGYARQDRKLSSRVPISAADVARMIEAMGVDRVVAVDLHCGQIQGFFGPRVPVDNLEAQIIGLEYFQHKNLRKPVVVSPDAGGVYRARKFQEGLIARGYTDCGIAMLIKQRLRANEIESMDLVGSVAGSDVIIVDDMIDTAGTLCEAARELRKKGARRVFAFATHGLFSGPAIQRIEASPLEEVVVTDSIKARPEVTKSSRITSLSISVLLADAIRRIHQKESLNDLFNVKKE